MSVAVPLLLLLFAAAAFPWLLVLRARFGALLAIPATAAAALLLLLGVGVLSHLCNIDYLLALIGASVLCGVVGLIFAMRVASVLRRPSRYLVALWVPALLGALLWLVTVGLAQVIPGASRFGWTMNGDSLNNLFYASTIAAHNGIALGGFSNPVPLPAAIVAVALSAGAHPSSASADLVHQLSAYTLCWTLLLAATSIAMGVVVASLVKQTSTRTVAVTSALASLLPLTWFVSGLTIQWGYFNVSVMLPLLLGAWIVFLHARAHPVAAFVTLTAFATLALATWTPIAVPIAALGVAVVVRQTTAFRALRGWRLAAVVIGVAQAATFAAVETLPTYFSQGSTLAAGGIGFPNLWWTAPLVVLVVVILVVPVRHRTTLPVVSATVALLVGSLAASAVLLLLTDSHSDPWDYYYPKKLVWLLLVVLCAIALSFAIAVIAGHVRLRVIVMGLAFALIAAVILPPGNWPETLQRQPIPRVLGDYVRHRGETTVEDIVKLTTAAHSHILWRSGDPDEPIVNEWLLLDNGGLVYGKRKLIQDVAVPYFLYRASGRYQDTHIETLCTTLKSMNKHSTVYTADAGVAKQLRTTCPQYDVRVVLTQAYVGKPGTTDSETWETDGIE